MLKDLKEEVKNIGKPQWQPMLNGVAELHAGSIHAPFFKLPYQWEEIAPMGHLGVLVGGWDTVHIALDTIALEPKHALRQILNSLALQDADGMIPGHATIVDNEMRWHQHTSCPPLWPFVVQEYVALTDHQEVLVDCYAALSRQIGWFEAHRRSGSGFYYVDHLDHLWESGVEDSIRLENGVELDQEMICIDATAHLYGLYRHAALWAAQLQERGDVWQRKGEELKSTIQERLFDSATGFFHDGWMIGNPNKRVATFDGIWPLVVGAASEAQAQRVINESLLDPNKFFTRHPIPTVAVNELRFEYCHWRGPTRNSMSYWAAVGCIQYGRHDAAKAILDAGTRCHSGAV